MIMMKDMSCTRIMSYWKLCHEKQWKYDVHHSHKSMRDLMYVVCHEHKMFLQYITYRHVHHDIIRAPFFLLIFGNVSVR